jgi:hypothetical protein
LNFVIFLLMLSNPESTAVHLGRVYYDMTLSALSRESESALRMVADRMHAEPNLLIDLYGYKYGRIAPKFDTSREMAEKVKTYLIDNFGILADRIQTPDQLATRSSAPSKDSEDQWVEIVVRPPDAILAWFENDVKVQPPTLRPNWLKPLPDYYLYHGYKVATGKKSSAHISYPGKGMLRMDEDAMVIIHSLSLERRDERHVKNLRLQEGSLTILLEDVSAQEYPDTSTVADREIASQIQDTVVAEKIEDLVIVYQRNADVAELGREPVQQIYEDTIDEMESVLSIPPVPPTLVSPRRNETRYYPNEITFVWQPSGVLSHLQVAEDSLFEQIAFDTYAASESLVTALSENTYYWRVSGINVDSLEGDYANYWTFAVETDTLKPHLEIAIARSVRDSKLTVTGRTEIDADLFVDGETIKKESDGSFSHTLPSEPQNDIVVALAVDPAGNTTEKVCRIPGRPMFVMGVNSGFCLTASNATDGLEKGFWYGFKFSKVLLAGFSFFTTASLANSSGTDNATSNMTDILVMEVGFSKNFHTNGISPFLHIQAGFVRSQISMTRQTHPGIINYGGTALDPSVGFGAGGWIPIGRNWYLGMHADYIHIFNEEGSTKTTNSFTRIGIGIQDRML